MTHQPHRPAPPSISPPALRLNYSLYVYPRLQPSTQGRRLSTQGCGWRAEPDAASFRGGRGRARRPWRAERSISARAWAGLGFWGARRREIGGGVGDWGEGGDWLGGGSTRLRLGLGGKEGEYMTMWAGLGRWGERDGRWDGRDLFLDGIWIMEGFFISCIGR